jgi:N-acetylmuramoyl-L-alanine amidase
MPIEPLEGPWVVAVQPGHWKVTELPQEQSHRRGDTGTAFGRIGEADINKAVADALIPKLEAEGWEAVLIPATVPPGLRADAFISIHVDAGGGPGWRGWKVSPPWRPSDAARELAAAMSRSFGAAPVLVEEKGGVTVNMRGYFGFNYRRYKHAISPYTPAVLIELGRIGNSEDRQLLTTRPDFWADLMVQGLKLYFEDRERSAVDDLRPLELPWAVARSAGVVVRRSPREDAEGLATLEAGAFLIPVDKSEAWYEVFVPRFWQTSGQQTDGRRSGGWRSGWVHRSDVITVKTLPWPIYRYANPGNGQKSFFE